MHVCWQEISAVVWAVNTVNIDVLQVAAGWWLARLQQLWKGAGSHGTRS